MEIIVNSKIEKVPSKLKLEEYLMDRGMGALEGTAVAVNDCVISRGEWQSYLLHEHDKILIIRATQGG
jgi:sulfur carrier protein